MDKINVVYIKYKINFNKDVKHSSYMYQKVFRSIYGYHQNVTKRNKKIYSYFRKGVISDLPYIKTGKNSIILPKGYENLLINYFKTGENLAHNWKVRGDWKADYDIKYIDIDSDTIINSLINNIKNNKIINLENKEVNLLDEINYIINNDIKNKEYLLYILNKIKKIIELDWFKQVYTNSEFLSNFYNNYKIISNKYNN